MDGSVSSDLAIQTAVKGTAHLKQHSYLMAIFSSGMKIFKIAFQLGVDNSCMVPIAPFFRNKFESYDIVLAFWGRTLIFTILDSTPKRDAWFLFLFWEMV